ncbi:hypothetical protein GQ44DRAFT_605862 [Phaeosphaeriaceae sp. PMI808]|nr:hypothetical protein GQ44DRAFT_605862 [Phaeosphaeriaceae sp. PMI808]
MLSLPLAKLSTAQDATLDETKFSWSHDTQNLIMVIDTFGACGPSQLLKVVQGTQVRVRALTSLSCQSRDVPIFTIANLGAQQLIEIERLVNESNELIRNMQGHGVELKNEQLPISALVRCPLLAIRWQLPDKKVRRAQLKFQNSSDYDTAYSHLHRLGLRMTTTNESQSRTSNSQAANTLASMASSNSSYGHNAQASAPLPAPPRLTEVSSRPYSAVTASTSIEPHVQEAIQARPVSAYTGYGSNAGSSSTSFSGPLRPPEYFARPDSNTSTALEHPSAVPEFPEMAHDRPETALLFGRPDTAEAALPPRRELPFSRSSIPRSSGSDTARPSTSLMGPPPLPARVASLRPASSRTATADTDLPPLPKPTVLGSAQQQPSWMQQQLPRTVTQDQFIQHAAQASTYSDQDNRPYSNPSPSSSPLSYNRPSSNLLSPTRPFSSDAHNTHSSSSLSPLSTPPALGPSRVSLEQGFAPNSTHITTENLAAYATQSADSRRAGLNEFIYQHLQDDNFLILVEDMETCWARTGLGGMK